MSYILDALNKSEKDRASNQMPGLRGQQTDQPVRMMTPPQIAATLAALIIINCLGVYWYFGNTDADQAPINAGQSTTTATATNETSTTAKQPLADPAPKPAPLPVPAASTLTTSDAERTQPTSLATVAPTTQGPPNVEITAHIYADDAAFRMVKIDGIARHEGDTLEGGYRVLHITESGVVLSLGSQQYELNVVEDWQLVPAD